MPLAAFAAAFAAAASFAPAASCAESPATRLAMSGSASDSAPALAPGALDMTDLTGYLNAEDAASLDADLMSTPGFSLEQLMELAGLSVAEAVHSVLPGGKILLACGPGNNGGDGLVAARHLSLWGYDCTVVYPRRSSKGHFVNLVRQCEDVGVKIVDQMPDGCGGGEYAAVVDAVFGFSFRGGGGIREPFGAVLADLAASSAAGSVVISVDVPSGWDVNGGDLTGESFVPDVLISLTTPKLSSKRFVGRHFVGGRFLPPSVAERYGVRMPPYPGVAQVMEITEGMVASAKADSNGRWEEDYAAYLAEKEAELSAKEDSDSNGGGGSKGEEDWALQYQEYCIQKEKEVAEREKAQKDNANEERA